MTRLKMHCLGTFFVLVGGSLLFVVLALGQADPPRPALPENYSLGDLLDSMKDTITNATHPENSEIARLLNNSMRVASFKKMFPLRQSVSGYIVYDDNNRIEGIYPFPPSLVASPSTHVQSVRLRGTGEWYVSMSPTLSRPPANDIDAMKNWDQHVNEAANRVLKREQVAAYFNIAKQLRESPISVLYLPEMKPEDWFDLKEKRTLSLLDTLGDAILAALNLGELNSRLKLYLDDPAYVSQLYRQPGERVGGEILGELSRWRTLALVGKPNSHRLHVQEVHRQQQELAEWQARIRARENEENAEWAYLKSITGLACSRAEAMNEISAGRQVAVVYLNYLDIDSRIRMESSGPGSLSSCQIYVLKQIVIARANPIWTGNLADWAATYHRANPSFIERIAIGVNDFLRARQNYLDTPSSSPRSSEHSTSNRGPDCETGPGGVTWCRVR